MSEEAEILQSDPVFRAGLQAAKFLMRYHAYEVRGLRNVPAKGRALIAVSHSFATYDAILLGAKVFLERGRHAAALGDRRLFQTPLLSQFFSRIGTEQGSPEAGARLLGEERLLLVSPGGMREALRASDDKYRVDWEGRQGFVRLAVQSQAPIVLAACPAADDLYTLYRNPVTKGIYERFKWPAPLLRGWGFSLLPRPVKLVHFISKPFVPPPLVKGKARDSDVAELHQQLREEMRALMAKR